ncbi:hypothetical protein RCL1_004029 [Eukaryota sp. TZLM3-RCL]
MPFAVAPKLDCPHVTDVLSPTADLDNIFSQPCSHCDATENWLCTHCFSVNCSRYANSHGLTHFEDQAHPIVISLSDLSCYCYLCDSYIVSQELTPLVSHLHSLKFGSAPPVSENDLPSEEQVLESLISSLSVSGLTGSNILAAAELIRNANSIVCLVGAGLSVAAGIPDFRSEVSGLYAQIKQKFPYLDHPTHIFDLSFFESNPFPFYTLASLLIPSNVSPTLSHYFISYLDSIGKLLGCVSQNIDGLETISGISKDKLIQAHGSFDAVKCIKCGSIYPNSVLSIALKHSEPIYCNLNKCGGLLKPQVVFFGEALPPSFRTAIDWCRQADLIIVIGTSLQVFPFAHLVKFGHDDVARILINKTDIGPNESLKFEGRDLFLMGEADVMVKEILVQNDWLEEFDCFKAEHAFNGSIFEPIISDYEPIKFDCDDVIFLPCSLAPYSLSKFSLAILPSSKLALNIDEKDCCVALSDDEEHGVLGVLVKGDVKVLEKLKKERGYKIKFERKAVLTIKGMVDAFVPVADETEESYSTIISTVDCLLPVKNVVDDYSQYSLDLKFVWKYIGPYLPDLHWSRSFCLCNLEDVLIE